MLHIPLEDLINKFLQHHLRELGLSLFEIKDHDISIYDFYIDKIIKNMDISANGYFFEINQCAKLIRTSKAEKLDFKFGDHNKKEPDFIIDNYGFEITSSRFSDESKKLNPGRKLLGTFRSKNAKSYAKNDAALIIDMNQLTFHSLGRYKGNGIDMTFEEVKEIIKKDSNFGLVICIVEWIEHTESKINFKGTAYQIYSDNCSPGLRNLIEDKFIKGQTHEFKIDPSISSN